MTRIAARPLTPEQRALRARAARLTQVLDDAGYLAPEAYRPHVRAEIVRTLAALTQHDHVRVWPPAPRRPRRKGSR